ncbi:MAG: CHASE3 domain-containing protein [Xanthobacteraceae bacterium]
MQFSAARELDNVEEMATGFDAFERHQHAAPSFCDAVRGYLSYRYNILLRENRDLVVHTYQVINAIDGLLIRLEDAETGQRGYIITGDASYLAPYERTSVDLPGALAALDRLVVDNRLQLSRVASLRAAVTAKIDELGVTIALRQNKGLDAARSAVITNDGKRTMDEIRAIVGAMTAEEKRLLDNRTADAAKAERLIVGVAFLGGILSLVGRAVAALAVSNYRRRRKTRHENISSRG